MNNARYVAAGAWILALVMLGIVQVETLARRTAEPILREALASLDHTAGLRDDAGETLGPAITVRVDLDGPDWVRSAGDSAVAEDAAYSRGDSPHRLVGEFVVEGRAALARWSLERRGWSVHAPAPAIRRLNPALAVVPLLLGALGYWRWRRAAVVMPITALVAQLLSLIWPWPQGFPRLEVDTQLAASPLLAPLVAIARAMDDRGVIVAGGVIALCVVLAWFDHRRSRTRAPVMATGIATLAGVMVWTEAAARVGAGAWVTTWSGVVASVAMLVFFVATRPTTRGGDR